MRKKLRIIQIKPMKNTLRLVPIMILAKKIKTLAMFGKKSILTKNQMI